MSLIGIGPHFRVDSFNDVPATIPNLELWLRADRGISLTAGKVDTWFDISGKNRHATQLTSSIRPTYLTNAINNRPAVVFNGTDGYMSGPLPVTLYNVDGGTAKDEGTILIVTQMAVTSGNMGLFEMVDSTLTSETGLSIVQEGTVRYFKNPGADTPAYTENVTTPVYNLAVKVTTNRAIYRNTIFQTSVGFQDISINTIAKYQIAKLFPPTNTYFNGKIAEICVYSKGISGADITALNSYISARYSIP